MTDISKLFKTFVTSDEFKGTLEAFQTLCTAANVDSTDHGAIYRGLRSKVNGNDAKTLWKILDKRRHQEVYSNGRVATGEKVLIIGGGLCGLRMSIEVALLGGEAIVAEMRDYMSRNNVLHLWPFVITDVKMLGAKVFYPQMCTGSLNHMSIRRLQLILLKISLVLGVQIHAPVMFVDIVEPKHKDDHWSATFKPENHLLNKQKFNVVVAADGKRNTLQGFSRKCFRGKLAIAITANFVNNHTREENRVEEIGGIFYIFRQEFFNALKEDTSIDLENFVYYKDETHYFVMTAKKHCLLSKGVLKHNYSDSKKLLDPTNINQRELVNFAKESAQWATKDKMANLDFAKNHNGKDDVAIFDFTAMHQAEHSCLIREKHGKQLLECIVGDTLIEPFWPVGSGCARGFLGIYDAAWMLRSWCRKEKSPLELIAERENIYSLLSQTTSSSLKNTYSKYNINPKTRYNSTLVPPDNLSQVKHLYITDENMPTSVLNTPMSTKVDDAHPIEEVTTGSSDGEFSSDDERPDLIREGSMTNTYKPDSDWVKMMREKNAAQTDHSWIKPHDQSTPKDDLTLRENQSVTEERSKDVQMRKKPIKLKTDTEVESESTEKRLSVMEMSKLIDAKIDLHQQEGNATSPLNMCCVCQQPIYPMNRLTVDGVALHRHCLRCQTCQCTLQLTSVVIDQNKQTDVRLYCYRHAHEAGCFDVKQNPDLCDGVSSVDENNVVQTSDLVENTNLPELNTEAVISEANTIEPIEDRLSIPLEETGNTTESEETKNDHEFETAIGMNIAENIVVDKDVSKDEVEFTDNSIDTGDDVVKVTIEDGKIQHANTENIDINSNVSDTENTTEPFEQTTEQIVHGISTKIYTTTQHDDLTPVECVEIPDMRDPITGIITDEEQIEKECDLIAHSIHDESVTNVIQVLEAATTTSVDDTDITDDVTEDNDLHIRCGLRDRIKNIQTLHSTLIELITENNAPISDIEREVRAIEAYSDRLLNVLKGETSQVLERCVEEEITA